MPLELRKIENSNRIRRFNLERQKLILEKIKLRAKGKRTSTWYKDFVNPRNYRFVKTNRWRYKDPNKYDYKYNTKLEKPHFILLDKNGRARFMISYRILGDVIEIQSIQRIRLKENANEDTLASKKFQNDLGMHPSEFIFCEFIHQIKDKIKEGTKIVLYPYTKTETFNNNYMPIIARYFKKPKYTGIGFKAELDLEKQRTKALLQN